MVFSKGTQEKTKYTINNKTLVIVREYKHLGITINCKNCSFTPTLTDLYIGREQEHCVPYSHYFLLNSSLYKNIAQNF